MSVISVKFKVIKNEMYGDYRIDEFFDGEWNNQTDGGWSESEAKRKKQQIERRLVLLNGSMVVGPYAISCIG